MSQQIELIYGFIHCRGKTTYHAGFVKTQAEAEEWVKSHQEGKALALKVPPEDPIRYCKAVLCPFKRQKPWFDFIPPR